MALTEDREILVTLVTRIAGIVQQEICPSTSPKDFPISRCLRPGPANGPLRRSAVLEIVQTAASGLMQAAAILVEQMADSCGHSPDLLPRMLLRNVVDIVGVQEETGKGFFL